jgi:hypothetical protein
MDFAHHDLLRSCCETDVPAYLSTIARDDLARSARHDSPQNAYAVWRMTALRKLTMRKTIASAAALGLIATIFAGGTALGYGSHGGGGHGGGGHGGGGYHGGGGHGHGWYGGGYGLGIGLYGAPYYWPYGGYGGYGGYYDDGPYAGDYGGYSSDEGPPPGMQPGPGPQQSSWYYCDASRSYYPYVQTCVHPWQPVAPAPMNQPPG